MTEIPAPTLVDFLRKLHLFRGLSDNDLKSVVEELLDKRFDEEDTVFLEGSPADSFYLVYQGRVRITRKKKNGDTQKIASLVRGDYFGEQGLLKNTTRNATVKAEKGTVVLILYRDAFKRVLKKVPGLWANFDIMMDSRRLASKQHFDWRAEDEVIYFLARKHMFLLVRAMLYPVLMLFPVLGLLWLAYMLSSAVFGAIGASLLVLDVAWGLWQYVDWSNDYYIVTNQRVIWLEKVIGLYDSRSEAGMGTILSVSTESDFFSRWFDYGTVVVRTYTGEIRMRYVVHPKQAAAMIEEYWGRSKVTARDHDEEIMRQAIRNKMGIKPAAKPASAAAPAPAAPSKPAPAPHKPSAIEKWWVNAFKMRTEENNVVTYHKHVFVLFRNIFLYLLGILLLLSSFIIWPLLVGSLMPTWVVMLVILGIFVLIGYVVYGYLDWNNDVYQVTPDQIVDLYKKPFGDENRRSAPLETILGTEYKRNGIIENMLNFGTVYITVGGTQYDFDDVMDPPGVQQDIARRQAARLQKKKESDGAADRDRMAEWLSQYYKVIKEIEDEKKRSGASNPE